MLTRQNSNRWGRLLLLLLFLGGCADGGRGMERSILLACETQVITVSDYHDALTLALSAAAPALGWGGVG